MRLRNMLKICLVFWKSEPQYAYKLYAYKKKHVLNTILSNNVNNLIGKSDSLIPDEALR